MKSFAEGVLEKGVIVMKNIHYSIDRESEWVRMNPLQVGWIAYTVVYCIICLRRDSLDFLPFHVKISNGAIIAMSAAALILTAVVLIFNRRYEVKSAVKQVCYAMSALNGCMIVYAAVGLTGGDKVLFRNTAVENILIGAVLILLMGFELYEICMSIRAGRKPAGRGEPAPAKEHLSTASGVFRLLLTIVVFILFLLLTRAA